VLIPVQRLVDGLRHPRSRAGEAAALRRRLAAAPGPGIASAEEVEAALAIRRLKVALAAAFGAPSSCGGCARGHPLPHGRWNGGHCCSGRTEEIFTDAEVAALRLAGTTPARLTLPPPSDHAGCAFRGPDGCSLDPGDRPALCAAYVCRDLEAELRDRGAHGAIKALRAELRAAVERFGRLQGALRDGPIAPPWTSLQPP
jgi:hypothetical protein